MTTRILTSSGAAHVLALVTTPAAVADPPKPKKTDGHWSVLSVTVTFKNDKAERKGLLTGTSERKDSTYYSAHCFQYTDGVKTDVTAWLDTLGGVSETAEDGATLTFKNGTTRAVRYGKEGSRYIILRTENDEREVIDLQTVKDLKFVAAARTDADGNGLFDHWKFSPYTGEKLKPIDADKK